MGYQLKGKVLGCATPADIGSTPGSALSATSGHTNRLGKLSDVMVIFDCEGRTTSYYVTKSISK